MARTDAHCGAPGDCANPGDYHVTAIVGNTSYAADLCTQHLKEIQGKLATLGFIAVSQSVGRKRRNAYVGASGVPFSTREARDWLVAQGYTVQGKGRLSTDLLETYRVTH